MFSDSFHRNVGWLGTVVSVIGSFLVALGFMFYGYGFFIIGAFSWLLVSASKRDGALFTLNAFFFVANAIGLYRNF